MEKGAPQSVTFRVLTLVVCVGILSAGVFGMMGLAAQKKTPQNRHPQTPGPDGFSHRGKKKGEVHRVVRYDSDTRTLQLAVRVSGENSSTPIPETATPDQEPAQSNADVPLLDGMFCKVLFQGRTVTNVVKAPRSAFNADNTVYLSRDGRLKTLAVVPVMSISDAVYITGAFYMKLRTTDCNHGSFILRCGRDSCHVG